MTTSTLPPIMLFDQPDDWPDVCWVQTTVSEDEARDRAAEFCADEEGENPYRPVGPPAFRVWQRPKLDQPGSEGEAWEKCQATDKGAVEFWRISVF